MYTDNAEDRKDLAQEIVYHCWRSFDSFNGHSKVSTWMYRVAMNVSVQYLKKSKRKIATVPLDEPDIYLPVTEVNLADEKWQQLQLQIKNLNLLEKGILMLYLDNKSHGEIAHIIGISTTNVGTKISRIKEKLKQQISKKL